MIPSQQISADTEDEIDLITIWRTMWGSKYIILLSTGFCGLVALCLALTADPIYRAEVVITEVHARGVNGAASLTNQLGGLASLAGINIPGGYGEDREAPAILQSRRLVAEFVKSQGLLPVLLRDAKKPPTLWLAVKRFQDGVLSFREEKRTGLTTVVIDWTNPVTAAQWVNSFVALANEIIRTRALADANRNVAYLTKQVAQTNVVDMQRVMYDLIESETKTLMLANARIEYAFTVVDPAVAPEIRISPKRTIMVIVGCLIGLMIGVFVAFLRRAHHAYR